MIAVLPAVLPVVAQQGVIVGAEGYVWAAYAVTWLFVLGYTASLWARSRPS